VGGDHGGAGRPLALDGVGEGAQVGVAGRRLRQQPEHQRPGPLPELAAQRGVAGQAAAAVGLGQHRLEGRPLGDRDRLVVAGKGDVVDRPQQRRLAADGVVDGLGADLGPAGHRLDGRARVALGQEQLEGGVDDPARRRSALARS
jgi:hypothetical protein